MSMGYTSDVSGRLTIEPPLTAADFAANFAANPETPVGFKKWPCVVLNTDMAQTEPGGFAFEQRATAIVPAERETYYEIAEDIQAIVDAFPDRAYLGWLIRSGADAGDVERYGVRDGQVFSEQAILTWPDGTKAAG